MSEQRQQSSSGGVSHTGSYRSALSPTGRDRCRKRGIWSVLLAIALVVLAASLVMLALIGFSYFQGQQKYARLAESADLGALDAPDGRADIDWDTLLAANPDTVAWLYIPGTSINYPVVRGTDNEYYLTHDFDGDAGWLAMYGAVFMDWRNDPDWSDAAYFVYGHHMADGSMFADIAGLADQARFDASRVAYLFSPEGDFKLRTFSLVHCAADDPLVQVSFASAAERTSYVQNKIDRSVVNVGAIPRADDIVPLFAFATCDDSSAGRYVLYAYVEDATGEAAVMAEAAAAADELAAIVGDGQASAEGEG